MNIARAALAARSDIIQAATGGPDFTPKEWPEPRAEGLPYGLDNPAPGTKLWRLRNHPDTLTREDAILEANALDAMLAACRAATPPAEGRYEGTDLIHTHEHRHSAFTERPTHRHKHAATPRAEGLREALREALRGTRCQPDEPELDAIYRRVLAATPPAEGLTAELISDLRSVLADAANMAYDGQWFALHQDCERLRERLAALAPEQPE